MLSLAALFVPDHACVRHGFGMARG